MKWAVLALAALLLAIVLASGAAGSLAPATARAEDAASCSFAAGWNQLNVPPAAREWVRSTSRETVINLAPSRVAPRTILAGGLTGLYRTEDCGATWQILNINPGGRIPKRDITVRVAVDAYDDYYTWDSRGPMFMTRDQGNTWEAVPNSSRPGEGQGVFYGRVTAASALNGGVIYAESFQVHDMRNPPPVGLWRSYDRGRSWEPVEITAQRPSPLELVHNQRSITAVDPYDATLLYGVTTDGQIIMSRDAAASWEVSSLGNSCGLLPSEVWRTIKLSATGDRFWLLTNSGRLLVRRASDGACTGINPPSVTMRVDVIAPAPFDSAVVYAVTSESEDRQLWVYRDPTTQAEPAAP